jgi:hypothetical protein
VQVSKLQLIHLDERTVSAFLTHHEQHRHNGTRTRNNRRIALRGGFQHALRLDRLRPPSMRGSWRSRPSAVRPPPLVIWSLIRCAIYSLNLIGIDNQRASAIKGYLYSSIIPVPESARRSAVGFMIYTDTSTPSPVEW